MAWPNANAICAKNLKARTSRAMRARICRFKTLTNVFYLKTTMLTGGIAILPVLPYIIDLGRAARRKAANAMLGQLGVI